MRKKKNTYNRNTRKWLKLERFYPPYGFYFVLPHELGRKRYNYTLQLYSRSSKNIARKNEWNDLPF